MVRLCRSSRSTLLARKSRSEQAARVATAYQPSTMFAISALQGRDGARKCRDQVALAPNLARLSTQGQQIAPQVALSSAQGATSNRRTLAVGSEATL